MTSLTRLRTETLAVVANQRLRSFFYFSLSLSLSLSAPQFNGLSWCLMICAHHLQNTLSSLIHLLSTQTSYFRPTALYFTTRFVVGLLSKLRHLSSVLARSLVSLHQRFDPTCGLLMMIEVSFWLVYHFHSRQTWPENVVGQVSLAHLHVYPSDIVFGYNRSHPDCLFTNIHVQMPVLSAFPASYIIDHTHFL